LLRGLRSGDPLVIYNDEFKIRHGLLEDAPDRFRNVILAVVNR